MAAKEKLQDLLEWAQDRWVDFRARSGFFQARVALVVAYVLIVGATVLIFPPPAPPLDVKVQRVEFGVTHRTKVLVRNLNLGTVDKAEVVIHGAATDIDGRSRPGVWRTKKDRYLDQREELTLEGKDLKDERGRAAPAGFTVDRLEVWEDGDLLATWQPERS